MIGKIVRGSDFAGLLRYLTAARKDLTPDHIETHHIVNADLAAQEMTAVADAATHRNRIKRPVAHFMIGWRKDENPTLSQQKEVARRILRKLNLQAHQAVIVVHPEAKLGLRPGPDGRHFETHIAVNRVAFDGSVAKLDREFQRLEIACAEIAHEMNFLRVPGRHNDGAVELQVPGVGNRIGSIAAQTGTPTLGDELRQNHAAMERLRDARRQDWNALLSEFQALGIIIRPGRQRRRTDLHRGLVMVDRNEPERSIKISCLNSPGESWSSIALEKELGPMPVGWATRSAKQIETPTPKPDLRLGTGEISPDRPMPDEAKQPIELAAEVKADPSRLARLRAAREVNWAALIAEFYEQGIGIAPGFNVRRNTASGLVMVDLANPSRRSPLSALDTPTEKWGQGSLTKLLGPWPGVSSSAPQRASTGVGTEPENPPRSFETTANRRFDRDAAYRAYVEYKGQILSRNRDLNTERGARMDAMVAGQRRQRDRHYALRRLRRHVIRSVFGWRSPTGKALNADADALFDSRMKTLARNHRDARSALSSEMSARRASVPTWAEYLRAAQHDYVRDLAERDRLAKAEADWLLETRRRGRLKQGDEAAARLARARAVVDHRLQERYGSRVESMLNNVGMNQSDTIVELLGVSLTPSERRRLPMLIEGLLEQRRRQQFWLEQVRARRDRLRGSNQVRERLDRAREMRDRRVGEAALAAMMSRRSGLNQGLSRTGEGLWAAIGSVVSQGQGGPTHLDRTERATATATDSRHETTIPDLEHANGRAAARSGEAALPPDQRYADEGSTRQKAHGSKVKRTPRSRTRPYGRYRPEKVAAVDAKLTTDADRDGQQIPSSASKTVVKSPGTRWAYRLAVYRSHARTASERRSKRRPGTKIVLENGSLKTRRLRSLRPDRNSRRAFATWLVQARKPASVAPVIDRKGLVVRIAMVLIANNIWSAMRGDLLGALVGVRGVELWRAGHVLSQTEHAQLHPAEIPPAEVQRVWIETRRQARTASFPELLAVVDGFGRDRGGKSRV